MDKHIEYLYLLDYSDSTICEIELTEEDANKDAETVLEEHGCKADNCAWMFSREQINHILTI